MSLFKRLSDVVRSNISAMLDKAEDPVKLANQYLSDMREDIADAERELTNVMAQERLLAGRIEDKQAEIEKRKNQINGVLEKDENLAKELIASKQEMEQALQTMLEQHGKLKNTVEQLKPAIGNMHKEYDSLKQRRDALVAQSASAKAEKKVYDAIGGIGAKGAAMQSNFDRLDEKVKTESARAEASRELAAERTGQSLDHRVNQITSSSVVDELQKLKAERMKEQQENVNAI